MSSERPRFSCKDCDEHFDDEEDYKWHLRSNYHKMKTAWEPDIGGD